MEVACEDSHGVTSSQGGLSVVSACKMGQWGSWGACNSQGMQNRTRSIPRCLCDTFGCCPGPPGSDPIPWMGDDPSNDLVSAACRTSTARFALLVAYS